MKGISHSISAHDFDQFYALPPLLSSLPLNWEGMTVRTYQKPNKPGQTTLPPVSDVSLTLLLQGTLTTGYREQHDSWETFQMHAGDWSITSGGGEPQEICYHTLSSEPVQSLMIHVSADFLAQAASELTRQTHERVEIRPRLLVRDPLLTQIALTLQQELRAPTMAGKLYAETAAQMISVHLLRSYAQLMSPLKEETQRLTSSQLKRVREYVQDHLDQDLSVAEIAQQSGFSAFHFTRLFRQATGESPHHYVMSCRIEAVQRLLTETDLPVSQIALMTGFSSQSHLTRTLTRHLGQSPRQYRLVHS